MSDTPLWTSGYIQEISQCGRDLYTLITQIMPSKNNISKLSELSDSINLKGSTMANLCTTQLREANDLHKPNDPFIPEDKLINLEKITTEFLFSVGKVELAINEQKKFIAANKKTDDVRNDAINSIDEDETANTVESFREGPKILIENLKKLLLAASQASKITSPASTAAKRNKQKGIVVTSPPTPHSSQMAAPVSLSPQLWTMSSPGKIMAGGDVSDLQKQYSKVRDMLSELLSILSDEELNVGHIKELVKPLYGAYQELYQSGEESCMHSTIGSFRDACADLFGHIKAVIEDKSRQDSRARCSEAAKRMMEVSEKVVSEVLMAAADGMSQDGDTMSTVSASDDTEAAVALTLIREKDDEIRKLNKVIAQQNVEILDLKEKVEDNSLIGSASLTDGHSASATNALTGSEPGEREEIERMKRELADENEKMADEKIKLRMAIEKIADLKAKNAEELALIEEKRAELDALADTAGSLNAEGIAAGVIEVLCEILPSFKAIWDETPEKTKETYAKKVKKVVKKSQSEGGAKEGKKEHRKHRHGGGGGGSKKGGHKSSTDSTGTATSTSPAPHISVTKDEKAEEKAAGIGGDDLDMILLAQTSFAETFKRLCSNKTSSKSLEDWSKMNTELELFKATLLKHSNYKDDALKSAAYRDKVVQKASQMSAFAVRMLTRTMVTLSLSPEEVALKGEATKREMVKSMEDIRQSFVDLFHAVKEDMSELSSFSGTVKVGEKLISEMMKVTFSAESGSGSGSGSGSARAEIVEAASHSEHLREKVLIESVTAISNASVRIVKVLSLIMSSVCNLPFTSLDDKSKTPLWELVTWGHRLVVLLSGITPRFEIAKTLKTTTLQKDKALTDGSASGAPKVSLESVTGSSDKSSDKSSEKSSVTENVTENVTETIENEISKNEITENKIETTDKIEQTNKTEPSEEISLWDEILGVKEAPKCTFTATGTPQYISLNKLIEVITSPDDLSTDTIKAAVSTALSFAEPQQFLRKLIERFDVPESHDVDGMGIRIKNRVCIALQHYVEAQFDDFDESTFCALYKFVSGPLTLFNRGFGTGLLHNLDRRQRVSRHRLLVSQIPSTGVTVHSHSKPLLDLFMASDVATIAQQLTLIAAAAYASIKPKELLDLAWSKPKLQHRAANVIDFQERTALLSQFVAILTLSRNSPEERAEVLNRVLDVMAHLFKYNNFNDLMALYAGFANASVNRLVASRALIDPKRMKFLKHCDKLLAPMGSFKSYRHALGEAGFAAVPILSVVLSDLTFIDEGNPDTVDGGLINFEKRSLVHERIIALQKYQSYAPEFVVVEPLYSALLALPSCSDGVLYDLSLIREPRRPGQQTLRTRAKK